MPNRGAEGVTSGLLQFSHGTLEDCVRVSQGRQPPPGGLPQAGRLDQPLVGCPVPTDLRDLQYH